MIHLLSGENKDVKKNEKKIFAQISIKPRILWIDLFEYNHFSTVEPYCAKF